MKKWVKFIGYFLILVGIGGLMNKDVIFGLLLIVAGALLAFPQLLQKVFSNLKKADAKTTGGQPDVLLGGISEINDDAQRVLCKQWVVLDVETTGLSPDTDRVIEVAANKYDQGRLVDSFSSLVNPGRKIPAEITKLTGIRNEDLKNAPAFVEIAQTVRDFIGELPMVAHNAKFDATFIWYECSRAGVPVSIHYINTQKMAKWCFSGMTDYKLSTLIRELSLLDHDQEHRALSDVEATENLYVLCRQKKEKRVRQELQEKASSLL